MKTSPLPARRLADETPGSCRAVILRHPKERKSKCSVQPLIDDVRFHFVRFDPGIRYDAAGFLVLMVDAPPLTPSDRGTPFLILDSTWRYLPAMRSSLFGDFRARSLPATVKTAYPRVSKIANDPATGLASVEALYAALRITGERDDSLLDRYHWHREFLESYDRGEL